MGERGSASPRCSIIASGAFRYPRTWMKALRWSLRKLRLLQRGSPSDALSRNFGYANLIWARSWVWQLWIHYTATPDHKTPWQAEAYTL